MIESVIIIAFSLVLFAYWFRYTVLLLLSEDRAEEHQTAIGQLSLLETRQALQEAPGELPLDRLHESLEKDYRMLCYLLEHAAGLSLRPFEHHLLTLDYRLLRLWFRLARNASAPQARRALEEMAGILSCMAHKMGERAHTPSRA